jgi:hypothetical protein
VAVTLNVTDASDFASYQSYSREIREKHYQYVGKKVGTLPAFFCEVIIFKLLFRVLERSCRPILAAILPPQIKPETAVQE